MLFKINTKLVKIKTEREVFIMNTDKIYAEHIANEYSKKEESKVIALRKLDRKAKRPSEIFAYTNGVVMTLIFGLGMCLVMKVIGDSFILGIIIGIIGLIGICLNYPLYKKILNASKEKYSYDIIKLANEISNEEE